MEEIKEPTKKDNEEIEKNINEQERRNKKHFEISTNNLYDDYDDVKAESDIYKTNCAIKYLELVCKILPNFNHMLKKNIKSKFVEGIYTFPNKILYNFFKKVDDNYEKIINDFFLMGQELKIKNFTKEKIKKAIDDESICLLLNIYDMCARLTTTSKTIDILNDFSKISINNKILNIMMYENLGDFNLFTSKADELYDNTKNIMIKVIIKQIIRKHFICNKDIKQIGNAQRVADKYFGNNRKFLK